MLILLIDLVVCVGIVIGVLVCVGLIGAAICGAFYHLRKRFVVYFICFVVPLYNSILCRSERRFSD